MIGIEVVMVDLKLCICANIKEKQLEFAVAGNLKVCIRRCHPQRAVSRSEERDRKYDDTWM